jgi:TetR/AcrR family transcriptional regulator, transcriptional repressor for nem operon
MDISRSSFYAAFGCKRALFVACLDLFAERTQRVLLTARAERTPLEALEFFFERHLSRPAHGRASLGCMLVNTVLERAGVDDDAGDRASRHLGDIQRLSEQSLRDAGCATVRAGELAAMPMLSNEGMWVASRRRLTIREQRDPIATTFRMLREQVSRAGQPRVRRGPTSPSPAPGEGS